MCCQLDRSISTMASRTSPQIARIPERLSNGSRPNRIVTKHPLGSPFTQLSEACPVLARAGLDDKLPQFIWRNHGPACLGLDESFDCGVAVGGTVQQPTVRQW